MDKHKQQVLPYFVASEIARNQCVDGVEMVTISVHLSMVRDVAIEVNTMVVAVIERAKQRLETGMNTCRPHS